MKPPAPRIVFRHAAHGILGLIGFSGIGSGATMRIHQLLLSSANPPVCEVVVSLVIVNSSSDIESINPRRLKYSHLGFRVLVHVMVFVPKDDGCYRLKLEGLGEIDDRAGPPRVVALGCRVELPVGDIDAPQSFLVTLAGLRLGRCARMSPGRVLRT